MGVRDLISIATVGGYYPYTIVVYQIYLALVESKGHKPVSGAGTAIFLMLSKALSLVLHAATVNCRAELRGLKLQLLAFTAITTTALIIAARSDVDGYLTLGCVSTLPLTTSRAIGSCLMAAPSEAVTKRRIVCYDLAAAPGCLWTALVIYVLSTTAGRSSWPLRALVLNLPVLVTLLAWVLFPASEFYGPSRLAQIEAQIKASKTEPKPKKRTSLVRVRADSWNSWTQVIIEEVDAHREQPQLLGELPPEPSSEAEKEGKPPIPWAWFNPCFRVLAATHSIIFWCFAGVLYTVFPLLASETGPTLDIVNALYTVEGGVLAVATFLIMPLVGKRVAAEFFGAVWIVLVLPIIVVWTIGKSHWSMYLLALLVMDLLSNISNSLIGILMLRCFPWHCIPSYSAQINTLGGMVAGCSFLPIFLFDLLGSWDLAVLVGQSVPGGLLMLLYLTHWKAIRKIWRLAAVSQDGTHKDKQNDSSHDVNVPVAEISDGSVIVVDLDLEEIDRERSDVRETQENLTVHVGSNNDEYFSI